MDKIGICGSCGNIGEEKEFERNIFGVLPSGLDIGNGVVEVLNANADKLTCYICQRCNSASIFFKRHIKIQKDENIAMKMVTNKNTALEETSAQYIDKSNKTNKQVVVNRKKSYRKILTCKQCGKNFETKTRDVFGQSKCSACIRNLLK